MDRRSDRQPLTGQGQPIRGWTRGYAVDSQPVEPVAPTADESGLDVDDTGSLVGVVAIPEGGRPLDVELQDITLRLAE